jgi:hypothetical protein
MTGRRPKGNVSLSPSVLAVVAVLSCGGCAGGTPLLHPARTLPLGEIRAATGFSGTVLAAGLESAVRTATNEAAAGGGAPGADTAYAKGALAAASAGPGLAPIIAVRAGIGMQAEGGIGYTGRSARIDVRRSFDLTPHWALSIGIGGSTALYGHQDGDPLPGVDLEHLHGFGADVPVLVGYQSDGDLYMLWLGARAGWEHVDIGDLTSEPQATVIGPAPTSLSATRYWGGGLLGAAAGFRHVHVAMEIDASYASVSGQFGGVRASVSGLVLTPAAALWWRF